MYKNSFSRKNPGLIIFMIDQSGSMCTSSSYNNLKLCENAVNSVNNVVNELILKLTESDSDGDEIVKRSLKLVIIGYGGPNDEAYIILDKWIDEVATEYPIGTVKVATREGTFPQDCYIVVDPVADMYTPMAEAMALAKKKISDWVSSHTSNDDPTPILINISDGAPTDSGTDVIRHANAIKSLQMPDGNPQIFNIHISGNSKKDVRFPRDNNGLDSCASLLYDISSEVSSDLIEAIPQLTGQNIQGGEKMMMSNVADPAVLVHFLQIGTKVAVKLK